MQDRLADIGNLARKVVGFAILSAAGLAIDMGVFWVLVTLGLRAGFANLISASLAVTFVYFSSAKSIFSYHGGFLLRLFLLYAAYQVVAVLAASLAVDQLVVALGLAPLLAKVAILPVTFSANFLFMTFLLRAPRPVAGTADVAR